MKKSVVAIMYDFDKTLCTKDMQDYAFIPALGMTCDAFWREVNEMTDREEMDNILAYMFQMVQKAREKQIPRLCAQIYSFNTQSQKMFQSIGFVKVDDEKFVLSL